MTQAGVTKNTSTGLSVVGVTGLGSGEHVGDTAAQWLPRMLGHEAGAQWIAAARGECGLYPLGEEETVRRLRRSRTRLDVAVDTRAQP